VPSERSLREDQFTVERDLEAALGRRDQFDVLDDRRPAREQFVRQTDGTRYVVSGNAELDLEAMSGVKHRDILRVTDAELVAFRIGHQHPRVTMF
jgi:hypothetical protein